MSAVRYETLRRLSLLYNYDAAFRKATGLSLILLPAGVGPESAEPRCQQNQFCNAVAHTSRGHAACRHTEALVRQRIARTLRPHQTRCFAGMAVVGVPVIANGEHVATLLSGRVLLAKPSLRDFRRATQSLDDSALGGKRRAIQYEFFQIPVISQRRFQAMVELLRIFAAQIGQQASRAIAGDNSQTPPVVLRARQFIEAHLNEPTTIKQIARRLGFSPSHFCRVFKKATGRTLSEYVARVRFERARTLLRNPSRRMRAVAYQSGFGSISQFNSVFRRQAGQSPTAYRKSLRQPFPESTANFHKEKTTVK